MSHDHTGHDHADDQADYGGWPLPPDTADALAPDWELRIADALENVRVMLRKAVWHRITQGHFSTFTAYLAVRDGWIDMAGGIACEGTWDHAADLCMAELAARRLNSSPPGPGEDALALVAREAGVVPLFEKQMPPMPRRLLAFADMSVLAETTGPWHVYQRAIAEETGLRPVVPPDAAVPPTPTADREKESNDTDG